MSIQITQSMITDKYIKMKKLLMSIVLLFIIVQVKSQNQDPSIYSDNSLIQGYSYSF